MFFSIIRYSDTTSIQLELNYLSSQSVIRSIPGFEPLVCAKVMFVACKLAMT